MTQKSANLYVRIEPEVKEQAEHILSALGISASSAVNMFYKQIILRRGIPFEIALPPVDISRISASELSEELEKGYKDMLEGKTRSAAEAFPDIRKDFGV